MCLEKGMILVHFLKEGKGAAGWLSQVSVQLRLMILLFMSLSPTSGSLLSACQCRARFGSSVPLYLSLPCLYSPENKQILKKKKKKKKKVERIDWGKMVETWIMPSVVE